jgi:hypothetical protein
VKIGAANKKQLITVGVLLAILAIVVIYDFIGSGTSSAAPPTTSSTSTQAQRAKAGNAPISEDLDPTVHIETLESSRKVKYEAGGRNIFRMEEPPPPKPLTDVRVQPAPQIQTPTPTPPPPPIPLKFYGFANRPGETKKIFLSEGDQQNSVVFIAKQGDIVDRRYKVLQIQANSVQIEDVLYNNKQNIPLTAR